MRTKLCLAPKDHGRPLTWEEVRSGASNVVADGNGALRRTRVYSPRRWRSAPGLGDQSVVPPNAADRPKLGRRGWTGGPCIFWLSSPPTNRAWSRMVSADSRRRGPRASR
jgi:hypothetical protein